MNSAEHFDRLIDVLLREEIGGRRPPDLTGRILSRAFSRPRRLIRVWPLLAAAGILLALCGAWLLGPAYPPPETGGSLSGAALARGATCAVVGQPGFLNLGSYCRLRFEPGSEFRLEGAEWQEHIHLARGEV
ncbi:MAG: hypothetical protein N3A66_10720, partial [Planctomycetota bacterium]|nr:hypothetical protein [Planctomycetota bacterium]